MLGPDQDPKVQKQRRECGQFSIGSKMCEATGGNKGPTEETAWASRIAIRLKDDSLVTGFLTWKTVGVAFS